MKGLILSSSIIIIGLVVLFFLSRQGIVDTQFDEMVMNLVGSSQPQTTEEQKQETPASSPPSEVEYKSFGQDGSNVLRELVLTSDKFSNIKVKGFNILCENPVTVSKNKTNVLKRGNEVTLLPIGKKPSFIRSSYFMRIKNNTNGCSWIGFRVKLPKGKPITVSAWIRPQKDLSSSNKKFFGFRRHAPEETKNTTVYKATPGLWNKVVETFTYQKEVEDLIIFIFDSTPKGTVIDITDFVISTT